MKVDKKRKFMSCTFLGLSQTQTRPYNIGIWENRYSKPLFTHKYKRFFGDSPL